MTAGYAAWYYLAAAAIDLKVEIIAVIILALTNVLLGILRFVPGNLGLSEIVSGGMFKLLGGTVDQGILIALLIRFSALALTFSLGIFGVLINMKYLSIKYLKRLWQNLRETDRDPIK